MGISYKKLWVLLIEKDITRAQMRKKISSVPNISYPHL